MRLARGLGRLPRADVLARAVLTVAVLTVAVLAVACDREPTAPPDAEAVLAADERLGVLLAPCENSGHYDRDTSAMAEILVGKLERGEREPLSRAIDELGAMGEPAVEPLRRAVERWFEERDGFGPLRNALAAAGGNPAPGAAEVLLRGLQHPMDMIRSTVLRALPRHHADPRHFDALVGRIWLEGGPLQQDLLAALAACDPERTVERVLGWIEERTPLATEPLAGRIVARNAEGELAARAAALAIEVDPEMAPWLLAPAAVGGDDAARARMLALLDPASGVAKPAVEALSEADGWRLLLPTATADPDPWRRGVALQAAAQHADDERAARDALLAALDDADANIALHARKRLVELGDAEAVARTLAALDGAAGALFQAIQDLRLPMREDAELARTVAARVRARVELERDLPLGQRGQALAALAVVPLGDAQAALFAEIDALPADATLDTIRAHRWATIQAANGGPIAREALAERLPATTDPVERLDVLWAVASERDELSRRFLIERVEDDGAAELERLYAASLLARQGPATDVAPRLKRVALRLDGPGRLPLQCLLWHWF